MIKSLIFLTSIVFAASENIDFGSVQKLIHEGKAAEAIFLLPKIPQNLKDADPSAEHMFRAQALLKENKLSEAQVEMKTARELYGKSARKKTPTFFSDADISSLEHLLNLRLDRIEYERRPYFTKKEANKAAIFHKFPHIEIKNGMIRIEFRDVNYRIDSVNDFYKLMRDAVPAHVYQTEFHKMRIEYGRARIDHILYDEADELKTPDHPKEDEDSYKFVDIRPLSLVGEVFTYKSESTEEDPATGALAQTTTWTTTDLKTGRPAEILDYVELDSLAKALREDAKLRTLKDWPPMESKRIFVQDDATVELLKTKILGKDSFDFALYDYDRNADLLTVQILAVPKANPSPAANWILSIKVKPTFVFKKQLLKQSASTGFFMKQPPAY